jgi:hypothetical protein
MTVSASAVAPKPERPEWVPAASFAVVEGVVDCVVRRVRPPSSAETDQLARRNPNTWLEVSDHLEEKPEAE